MPGQTSRGGEIADRVLARTYSTEQILTRTRDIYESMVRQSAQITTGNFTRILPADLALLFELYDRHFFQEDLGTLIRASGAPVEFTLSSRMTRSAGLTKRYNAAGRGRGDPARTSRYEISLSTTLLFQTFQDVQRTVRVNGIVCNDRLEAAQRVFEHELMHLLEMLVFDRSSCDADPFKRLVRNYFGHTQTRHDLVTQQERARTRFDVQVGDRVRFLFEGNPHVGVITRITRRATILVEDDQGELYSDGKRYAKYYIPLTMLHKQS